MEDAELEKLLTKEWIAEANKKAQVGGAKKREVLRGEDAARILGRDVHNLFEDADGDTEASYEDDEDEGSSYDEDEDDFEDIFLEGEDDDDVIEVYGDDGSLVGTYTPAEFAKLRAAKKL